MSKASETRLSILQKSFELIYTKGYQATSIDDIIATTNVTKGAFYYHFKNKDEMGLSIISEILMPTIRLAFVERLENSDNPIDDIYKLIKYLLLEDPYMKLEYGCPVSNLTQEMTPWNTEFSKALKELVYEWHSLLITALSQGKKNGSIREDVDAEEVAYFVMSGYWGIRNFGMVFQDIKCYFSYLKGLKNYLKSLV